MRSNCTKFVNRQRRLLMRETTSKCSCSEPSRSQILKNTLSPFNSVAFSSIQSIFYNSNILSFLSAAVRQELEKSSLLLEAETAMRKTCEEKAARYDVAFAECEQLKSQV